MSKHQTVDDYVRTLDLEAKNLWVRSGSFSVKNGRVRPRQPAEVTRVKARLRARRWRSGNDAAKRPETVDIALSLLNALVVIQGDEAIASSLSASEYSIVKTMIGDLTDRGYAFDQIILVCRRLRKRLKAKKPANR